MRPADSDPNLPRGGVRDVVLAIAVVVAATLMVSWLMATGDGTLRTDRSVEESLGAEGLDEADRAILEARHIDDLDAMIGRRMIRVLTTYNKTNFFIADGELRGFEYELLQRYRAYLKTRVHPRSWPTVFVFIPVPFDQLLPSLAEGRGDIAAAGITVTPERRKLVAFTQPYVTGVEEIVVTAPGVEGLETLDDLSGRAVYVNSSTSYAQSLAALNERLGRAGRPPVEVVPADPTLATEDILEMVNAGIVEITIADNHLAELWAGNLPKIVLRPDLAVRQGGALAWAVRKSNPELLKSLNAAIPKSAKGTLTGNLLFKSYFEKAERIENPFTGEGAKRLAKLEPLFRKYAKRYGFDWLRIAAMAYQESRLDHGAKSAKGATGVMQVLPATARSPEVGIANPRDLESNVHAGVKYLAYLRDRHFAEPELTPAARFDFALAAYNAGPARVAKLRQRAAREGLDPDLWFANVEQVARREVGRETVDYVANIKKYYLAYKLSAHAWGERERARQEAKRPQR